MAVGDITSTYEGRFDAGSATLLTELNTLNSGAATAGADTKTILLVPAGVNGQHIDVYTLARAAA